MWPARYKFNSLCHHQQARTTRAKSGEPAGQKEGRCPDPHDARHVMVCIERDKLVASTQLTNKERRLAMLAKGQAAPPPTTPFGCAIALFIFNLI